MTFEKGIIKPDDASHANGTATHKVTQANGTAPPSAEDQQPFSRTAAYSLSWDAVEIPKKQPTSTPNVQIFLGTDAEFLKAFAGDFKHLLEKNGFKTEIARLSEDSVAKDAIYIMLDDAEATKLAGDPPASQYEACVGMMSNAKSLLWATVTDTQEKTRDPISWCVSGLARVARHENENLQFVTVTAQETCENAPNLADLMTQLVVYHFCQDETPSVFDQEYIYKSGKLQVPRLQRDELTIDWAESAATGKPTLAEDGYSVEPGSVKLASDGTYVIFDGRGDIAPEICRFLASHGAKHIVTAYHKTLSEEQQQALEAEMKELGVNIYSGTVDFSEQEPVQNFAKEYREKMPADKGMFFIERIPNAKTLASQKGTEFKPILVDQIHEFYYPFEIMQEQPSLDFYLIIPSLIGVLGQHGYGTYASVAAVMGPFIEKIIADKKPQHHYSIMHFGDVEGQSSSATKAGHPVKKQEFHALLEFCTGAQKLVAENREIWVGFDEASLKEQGDKVNLSNTLFASLGL